MFNLAPWFYRNLYNDNLIISNITKYDYTNFSNEKTIEVLVKLNSNLVPSWAHNTDVYSNADGCGTSKFINVAIHKAISEALERWAFYETIDNFPNKFSFDSNPSTTGMAAFPGFFAIGARRNAILEATERWAIHEFWRGNLPIISHSTSIENLKHYEIVTCIDNIKVSLLSFKTEEQFMYAFASDENLGKSFIHATAELSRNVRALRKFKRSNKIYTDFSDISDKRLYYFSSPEGNNLFLEKIYSSPSNVKSSPKVICDEEIVGKWTKYTKVWRFLYENSFPDNESDHKFFMF